MSIDFGSEWMKIGIVSPGVPMEIALNKESKRKTPTIISYRDNIRTFGEDAQTVGIRFPKNSYQYLLDLLGKGINHPMSRRINCAILSESEEFAEQSAHQKIKECVITVPCYFNQVERKAVLQAAKLADLKVLQLINNHMAVALNYGIFRTKDFNETAQYIMFYDMGASATTASIVSLQNVKTKERGYVETHPQISVIGVGYDRTLGGIEIQIRLRDHLAKKFNEQKKTTNDVFKNPRAMAKLFKEAGRVKNVLSANNDHFAQIEGLLDEQDFRVQVTREDLENLCSDIFERVGNPVEQALRTAGLAMDVISQVVLVGAGTRVPKVQEALQKVVKQELAKNLNTDEAAALGAVYKAADLSTGFQVKKFITKDAVLFPVQIIFEREVEGDIKQVKRMLFGLMNPYPQKKIITFNKHVDDFLFNVNYADLDYLPAHEILNIGSVNLTEVSVKGVVNAMKKNSGENVESKGIKAHFTMDESGLLKLVNVEYVVEKTLTQEPEEEGTFSKLGSTISKLFSGEPDKKTKEEEAKEEEKPSGDESENKEEKKETTDQTNKTEEVRNTTESKGNTTKEATEQKEAKPKVVTVKEPLEASEKLLTINDMSNNQFSASQDKLKKLNDIEKEINRRATALNKWLYEDGIDADANTYEEKLSELSTLTRDLHYRVFEHKERPEALAALHSMLNGSKNFLESARNLTKSNNPEKDVFTDVEIETLEKIIRETEEWRDKETEEQNKIEKHEPVKLTVKMISEKMAALDREVKYLVNKIKFWKPKKTEKSKDEKKNDDKKEGGEELDEKDIDGSGEKEETVEEPPTEEETEDIPETTTPEEDIEASKPSESDSHTEL
ncbi:hsc70cb isoform g-related [Holotrichia oblita]|uniref:Hsc70cb isoform g-related n=1 Tax=Holotrichia oblita TaxID=644536 RepID=A0ACB9T792_HOLOL|nr:hsc70cb isoform g-related [Holotrichia oblita]